MNLTDQQRNWLIILVVAGLVWWFMFNQNQSEGYYIGRGPAPLRFSAEGYHPGRGPIPNRFYRDIPYLRNYHEEGEQPYY